MAKRKNAERKRSARSYSDRTIKILWGRSAGRCAVPDCRIEVFADATNHDPVVLIGDIAHVEASSEHGPRGTTAVPLRARDEYDNLILLCKNCHTRIDGQKNTNTVESIKAMRDAHEGWVRASLPERGLSVNGWKVILFQGAHPIDATQATNALSPDFQRGETITITANPAQRSWNEILKNVQTEVVQFITETDPFECRFAVFPLAPVSACIATGFFLTNRPRVRLFQFHRDSQIWSWPSNPTIDNEFSVAGFPQSSMLEILDVALSFCLSAEIQPNHLPKALRLGNTGFLHVAVKQPSTGWLQSSVQLERLGAVSREVFEKTLRVFPNAQRWHVFYAGPAPGAVKIGQQLNPTMVPPVHLYEFNRAAHAPYSESIILR